MAAGGTLESFFDEHGFVLVDAPTAVTDFMDVDQCSIRRSGVYPREVEEIVRRVMPSRNINRIDHWSAGGGSHAPFPSGGSSGKKTVFPPLCILKMILLPRQARDNAGKTRQLKQAIFSQKHTAQ